MSAINNYPTGPAGPAGADGAAGKTILYGAVAPTTEGVDGDFYIDTVTSMLYGPKASGTWPAGTSLVGPAGSADYTISYPAPPPNTYRHAPQDMGPLSDIKTYGNSDTVYLVPFPVGEGYTIDRLGCLIGLYSSGAVTRYSRYGIYSVVDGLPHTLLLDAGTVSCNSTSLSDKSAVVDFTFESNTLYALAKTSRITGESSPYVAWRPNYVCSEFVATSSGLLDSINLGAPGWYAAWPNYEGYGTLPETLTSPAVWNCNTGSMYVRRVA